VQQNSASNDVTANNSAEAATTSQSLPKTKGSAHTYIRSLAAKSAAKLATMNLMQTNGINGTDTDGNEAGTPGTDTGTGTDRNAGDTVDQNNINDQPAKENQKLANENNLTSSDNYSSNIYKGTDGKYYKVVTIYGNDYVYHAADIQANGGQTAADTKNNIDISKEDLGNGQTRWTVTFFPNKGLQNVGGSLHGLISAKFGIALTKDYQIVGNVDMKVINDPNQKYTYYKFEDGSNSPTSITVQNPQSEVDFSFNPNTDVDPYTGLINNSNTLPAYNNKYLQPSYYFTTATNAGIQNLWQTYFKDADERNNAYDNSPYLGGNHDFHFSTGQIANETGVDGAKQGDPIIYDTLGARKFNSEANSKGVFSSDNFNQAMEFKSQGKSTGSVFYSRSQYSSYVISFTTQHTDSHETELSTGSKNQQFSGISANIYSYQNGTTNMFSRLYGEQRVLDSAGEVVKPNDVISGWVDATRAMAKINTDYLNNAQIYALRYKIQNNVTDSNALNNIIKEGNALNDAMKKLGNSIGQYDSDGSFADHKEDTTKASDRYKYANPDKKAAYDNATEATKALINKDTGAYADQATVEKLTEAENKAWNELKVVLANKITPKFPKTKVPVTDPSHLTDGEKAQVQKNVEDANKDNFPEGTTVTVGDSGAATITYPDQSTDTMGYLVRPKTDAEKTTPNVPATPVPVANTSSLTETEKDKVKKNVEDANKDKFPADTVVTVGDDGTATITYPDKTKSTDTIPGSQLVRPTEDKDSYDPHGPKNPDDRVPVKDPDHLTDGEKNDVKDEIGKENPDLPKGTEVDVDDKGNATIKYPDGSKDTIPGDQLVQGQKGDTTDAGKITPTVPGGKVTVKDPSHLTDDEKNQVKNNVDNANKDKFPDGTTVTVGDDGTATVTYPDGSKDTIPGDQLVQGQKGDTTDAGKITPTVPGDKVTVKDPSHLTDDEKNQVKNNVDNANKD
ncbi:LEA family epithelial adhesin, partial [Lactobacillus crispatus]